MKNQNFFGLKPTLFIAIVCIIYGGTTVFGAANNFVNLIDENFNLLTLPNIPSGWTKVTPANTYAATVARSTITTGTQDTGNCLKLLSDVASQPQNNSSLTVQFQDQADSLILEFDYYLDPTSGSSLVCTLNDDSSWPYAIGISLNKTNITTIGFNPAIGTPNFTNDWHKIKLVVSVSKHYYTIYVDGVLKTTTSISFRNTTINKLSRLYIGTGYYNGTSLGYVDNLKVSVPTVNIPADATFSQIATPSGFSPEMPKLSDVCMRLFYLNASNGPSMLTAGSDFHITRGVWSYIEDKTFINQVVAKGWKFQATLNLSPKDPAQALHDKYGNPIRCNVRRDGNGNLIRDNAGNYVDDGKSAYREDFANPAYRNSYLQRAKNLVDMGVTSFQRDDPDGGCFDWGGSSTKEALRDCYTDQELLDFHSWARTEIEKYAGKKLTFSTNCGGTPPFMQVFDYRMTEVRLRSMDATQYLTSPNTVRQLALNARLEKKLFMLTGQEDLPDVDFRWIYATSYAAGNLQIVPWDQFQNVTLDPITRLPLVPQDQVPRIFIAKEKFADLTGFVRANAQYLDGYEEAAVGGFDLLDVRYGCSVNDVPLLIEGGSGQLSAYIRAKPGDANAPVVMHLVERGAGAPTTLRLRTARFFGKNAFKVKLRIPRPYLASEHATAEQNKNYESLITETTLTFTTNGDWTTVSLPSLSTWGIIVVEKVIPKDLITNGNFSSSTTGADLYQNNLVYGTVRNTWGCTNKPADVTSPTCVISNNGVGGAGDNCVAYTRSATSPSPGSTTSLLFQRLSATAGTISVGKTYRLSLKAKVGMPAGVTRYPVLMSIIKMRTTNKYAVRANGVSGDYPGSYSQTLTANWATYQQDFVFSASTTTDLQTGIVGSSFTDTELTDMFLAFYTYSSTDVAGSFPTIYIDDVQLIEFDNIITELNPLKTVSNFIVVKDRQITINDYKGESVFVYSITGQLVAKVNKSAYNLDTSGLYIVKMGDKTQRIVVK